ncbi:MAG: hypothetical protein KQH79_09155 [Bacteroidetes bacterium]|nr:hypothetical protein [Bacteroidota bacterium]
MNNTELKKRLVDACIDTLEKNIETIRNRISEIIQTANDYEGDHDIFDPFKEDMMKKKDLQVKQLEKHLDEIKLLKKVNPEKISDKVEFGSVVVTDKQNMFVSIALGKLLVENESYYIISTQVPVFKAMQDKKKGDTFTINNNQFTIKNLF